MAASLAEAAGNLDWAAAAYRRMLAADPASQPANAGLAHILIAGGHYPEAETVLRTALEITPDDPTLNAQLAAVLVAEDKAEALPVVEKLHSAHPEDQAITRMLAKILAASGDPVESDKLYLQLLKTAPDDPVLLVGHGQNLIHQLQFAAAQTAFEKAAAIDPASGEAWSGLAFAASRNQHPEITLHALTERSKLLPEVPSSYFLWATAYDTLHQRGQAAAYYHHFLEAAKGKFPDQEWQARQRLKLLER
jgi:Flp pilus assembly protein TadD